MLDNSAASSLIPLNPLNPQSAQIGKIKGYVTLDVRLAWKPFPALELSMVGQNLLAGHHLEYMDEGVINPTTIPRSVYGKVAVEF